MQKIEHILSLRIFLTSNKIKITVLLYVRATNFSYKLMGQPVSVKNKAGLKLEKESVKFHLHRDSSAVATFDPPTRISARTATNLQINLVKQNEILTMTGKNHDRH